jgi:hypothetical protein
MRAIRLLSAACAALALLTIAAGASADLVDKSAGLKLAGGGNLWTTPSGVPGGHNGLGFAGDGGGIGYGIGAYGELRVVKFLGLEVGVAYDNSSMWRNVTINGAVDTREKFTASNLRIPLLLKGILPLGLGRASIGIGPELIVPLSASASVEVISGPGQVGAEPVARTASSTMLTTDLGLVIAPPGPIEIPIDLRVSKNLSQPDAWLDRVSGPVGAELYTVQAQSSWDFRLVAGVGVNF